MPQTNCLRCDGKINVGRLENGAKCTSCGATYEYQKRDIGEKEIDYFFAFKGFGCIHRESLYKETCNHVCPGPGMYCKEHLTDKDFEKAQDAIKYSEQRLEENKETLEAMKESKRLWLVNRMSGIDEQDDTLSESQDW